MGTSAYCGSLSRASRLTVDPVSRSERTSMLPECRSVLKRRMSCRAAGGHEAEGRRAVGENMVTTHRQGRPTYL